MKKLLNKKLKMKIKKLTYYKHAFFSILIYLFIKNYIDR